MERINAALSRYQQIIGAYDKQLWERSVERAVLKGLKNVARKTARVNPDLIDVDLVRGSTFSKPKPQHGWFSVSWRAIPRVLFLPFFYQWWKKSTCVGVYCVLTLLYIMQLTTLVLYCFDSDDRNLDVDSLSLAHVLTPCILMVVLALVHTQIMAAYGMSKKSRHLVNSARETLGSTVNAVRQSSSEHESVGSRDTGIDLNPDDVPVGYHPSVSRLLAHRRRSRSVAASRSAAAGSGAPRVIDADDETDDSSVVGKDAASSGRRSTSRSASFDKTMEWLMTHTSSKCPAGQLAATRDAIVSRSSSQLYDACGCDDAAAADTQLQTNVSGDEAAVPPEVPDSRPDSPCQLSSPSHSVRQPQSECVADDDGHRSKVSADTLNVGLRRRVMDSSAAAAENVDSDVADCRRRRQVQGSRQALMSSADSETDIRNCRRPKQKIATSEWEYTVNTDMTSCDSTGSVSASELSENDDGRDDAPRHTAQPAAAAVKELASSSDKVNCMIWESGEAHKVELTVVDIGWKIVERVDYLMSEQPCTYFVLGVVFSLVLMLLPVIYRVYHTKDQLESLNYQALEGIHTAAQLAFGHNWRQMVVIINGLFQRLSLSLMLFFLLSVAEKTYQERLLYAKNFCYLTSSRRARKYSLPHFRLNKVRTIRSWLSLRSFLKHRGPQRSVENIVSMAFVMTIVIISVLSIELLQDASSFVDHLGNWELVLWCLTLSVFLMRYVTLGTSINKKYRNFSVLITEQINLYVHMEQKPHKKEELMIANSVLKLAENLIKELESPFRVSGLAANPLLYNITKVVVLSAFSAVLTELLGFKLKLYKIKMRA